MRGFVLFLLWCLVEVHCQTAPYVTFMGNTIPNHGYVDLGQVGEDASGSDSVQCHTDLETCCSGNEGPHRGDWYFPDGTRVPFSGDITENRGPEIVIVRRRNNANSPTGIYRCDIPTNAVHDDDDKSVRDTVYVGLYTASGGMYEVAIFCVVCDETSSLLGDVMISGNLTFDSDQLTLTCISTGGPATTVSWTRDSTTVITEGTETVLIDPVVARYTHTPIVTTAGEYTCTVANNKPSSASASITLQGKVVYCCYCSISFLFLCSCLTPFCCDSKSEWSH